jgi:hypothetical protein
MEDNLQLLETLRDLETSDVDAAADAPPAFLQDPPAAAPSQQALHPQPSLTSRHARGFAYNGTIARSREEDYRDEAVAPMLAKLLSLHCPAEAPALTAQWGLGEEAALLQHFSNPQPLIPPDHQGYAASLIGSQPTQRLSFFQDTTGVRQRRSPKEGVLIDFKEDGKPSGFSSYKVDPFRDTGLYMLTSSRHVVTSTDG